MSELVFVKHEPCWVQISGLAGKLSSTIKAGVRPYTYRKWDNATQSWWVHYKWLRWVVDLARTNGWQVDYSGLPTQWQLLAAGAQVDTGDGLTTSDLPTGMCPFETLYVQENAPEEVVKAAYRALVSKYHPDVGGDADQFRRIDFAYRRILQIRGEKP